MGCRSYLMKTLRWYIEGIATTPNSTEFNNMSEERDGLFIEQLMSRDASADDIDGVEGIEARDSPEPSQIARTDPVGLVEITRPSSPSVWIGRSAGSTFDPNLFRLVGSGQKLLNGRDDGGKTNISVMELNMDRLGPDAGEYRTASFVGRQFIRESLGFADN